MGTVEGWGARLCGVLAMVTLACGSPPSPARSVEQSNPQLVDGHREESGPLPTRWIHTAESARPSAVSQLAYDAQGSVVAVLDYYSPTYFAGEPLPYVPAASDALTLVKVRFDGTVAWHRQFVPEGNAQIEVQAMAIDGTGNVFLTGLADGRWDLLGGAEGQGFYLAKLSPEGERLWGRYTRPARGTTLVLTGLAARSDGDVIALARLFPHGEAEPGSAEAMLIHYDGLSGEPRSDHRLGSHAQGRSIGIDQSDNLYLAGTMWGELHFGEPPVVADGPCVEGFVASWDSTWNPRWSRSVDFTVEQSPPAPPCTERSGAAGELFARGQDVAVSFSGRVRFQGERRELGSHLLGFDASTGEERWARTLQPGELAPARVAGSSTGVVGAASRGDAGALGSPSSAARFYVARFESGNGELLGLTQYPATPASTTPEVRGFALAPEGSATALGGTLVTPPTVLEPGLESVGAERGFLMQATHGP